MIGDTLLTWMSFRGSGSRDELPPGLLGGRPPGHSLRDLAVLGHVEIASNGRWQIVPPVLAGTADEDGAGGAAIICGARTPVLAEVLRAAANRRGITVEELAASLGPARWRIRMPEFHQLSGFAAEVGLPLQIDASLAVLASLPRISNWPRESVPPVAGRVARVERFSRSELQWRAATLEQATAAPKGLFRIQRDWDTVCILKDGPDRHCAIETAAGRLAIARGLKQARIGTEVFSIPAALYPPLPIARALSLCSGMLPGFADGHVTFAEVPARVARLALEIMELRTL